jgi:hypothetical protein
MNFSISHVLWRSAVCASPYTHANLHASLPFSDTIASIWYYEYGKISPLVLLFQKNSQATATTWTTNKKRNCSLEYSSASQPAFCGLEFPVHKAWTGQTSSWDHEVL